MTILVLLLFFAIIVFILSLVYLIPYIEYSDDIVSGKKKYDLYKYKPDIFYDTLSGLNIVA